MFNILGSEEGWFGCSIGSCPLHEEGCSAHPKAASETRNRRSEGVWLLRRLAHCLDPGLKMYLDFPNRRLLDVLHVMHRISRILDSEVPQLPNFSIVCPRMQKLQMPVWRELFRLAVVLYITGENQMIDTPGLDRVGTSQNYAKRTNDIIKVVKTTALTDYRTDLILYIYIY